MASESKVSKGLLYQMLRQLRDVSAVPAKSQILKAIPLAYPIVKVGFEVQERPTFPMGLVERCLLEALQEFGPMSAVDLENLLGLDERVISRTLEQMMESGRSVRLCHEVYEIRASRSLKPQSHTVKLTRSFLLNGITGHLCPINLLDANESVRLMPVAGKGLKDLQGNDTAICAWLNSVHGFVDGRDEIERLIGTGKAGEKEILGIPPGMESVGRRDPAADDVAWIPALMLVYPGDKFQVFLKVKESLLPVLDHNIAKAEWLQHACNGIDPSNLTSSYNIDQLAVQIQEIASGVYLEKAPQRQTVLVGIKESLAWPMKDIMAAEERSDCAWLRGIMTEGILWDISGYRPSYTLLNLLPADAATAKLLCLLRGRQALRRLIERTPASFDLHTWWSNFQRDLQGAQKISTTPASLDELKKAVELTPDTNLHERFESLWKSSRLKSWIPVSSFPQNSVVPIGPTLLLNQGLENCLGTEFSRLVNASSSSIRIISPVIDDEIAVGELVSAVQRRVSVQVITELRDQWGDATKYPTRGFGFEKDLDLPSHFASIRKLAQGMIRCRAPRFCPHAKLWIFDGTKAVLTSANLNSNSLGRGSVVAIEAAIVFVNDELVSYLSDAFEQLWQICPFRQHRSGNNISISEEASEHQSESIPQSFITPIFEAHWNIPPSCNLLLQQIIKEIKSAECTVLMSALSLYDTQKMSGLHSALLEKLKRGVKVTIVVRHDHFPPEQYPDTSTSELIRAGLKLVTQQHLHFKGLLVDDRRVGVFSANLNPYSLNTHFATSHIELGIFGAHDGQLAGAAEFLKSLSKTFEYEYRS